MLTLYIMRHGQTHDNFRGIITGHGDSNLTKLGRKMVWLICEKVREVRFDKIYSSDLTRAYETARIVARRLGMNEINKVSELRELDYGIYAGRRKDEVMTECPEYRNNIEYVFPEGEGLRQLQLRTASFIRKLQRFDDGKTLLLVSHAGPIRTIVGHLLDQNLEDSIGTAISHKYLVRVVLEHGKLKEFREILR